MRPAMIVLGLAVLIVGAFVALAILSSRSPARVRAGGVPSAVPGSPLQAEPAAGALRPIVGSGIPPSNIINAVTVPVGSVRISHENNAASAGQFDAQVTLRSDDSQGALLAFFASSMHQQGWQVFDRGPAANKPGTLEVLGKLAGTDGYYWEMGATISPTTFGPGAPPAGETDFTVRLLQQNDDQS